MAKKSVRKMNYLERMSHSLPSKIFHAIVMFSIVLSLIAVAFGFYLYYHASIKDNSKLAKNVANTTHIVVSEENLFRYIEDVQWIYDSTEENVRKTLSDEYLSLYKHLDTIEFENTKRILHDLQRRNGVDAVYIGIYDKKLERLIYVIDSENGENHRQPGYWESVSASESREYLDRSLDVPYKIENSKRNGYTLRSWDIVSEKDNYLVLTYADVSMAPIIEQGRKFLVQYLLMLLLVTVIMAVVIANHMKKVVINPIQKINDATRAYIADRENPEMALEDHFKNLDIHTGDEIESLALIIADMEREIKKYVANLTKVTSEKEKISTELNVASQIQEGVLPNVFPAFPGRNDFDIYATMNPAKEVGGDFYDYFLIDDDHLALVIADVSGKGIPAALFMMACKLMISNVATLGIEDPSIILNKVNEAICKNNPAEMFVTVWLGIMNLKTGLLKAANAGHEYPCIASKDGKFTMVKDKHGLVIGGMEGLNYKTYELQLKEGDGLFVYTDGVTEATNANDELFGNDRLLEALNKDSKANVTQMLDNVKMAIDTFVQDAPQFDDITMLGFRYLGSNGEMSNMEELTIEATIDNIPTVTEFVDKKLEEHNCPLKTQTQIDIVIDELFSNIANYAYDPETGPATVRVEVDESEPMAVYITFIDGGKPYDPLKQEDPDTTLSAEERSVGGLGIFLVKKTMDDITYEYKDGKNILRIKKHMQG